MKHIYTLALAAAFAAAAPLIAMDGGAAAGAPQAPRSRRAIRLTHANRELLRTLAQIFVGDHETAGARNFAQVEDSENWSDLSEDEKTAWTRIARVFCLQSAGVLDYIKQRRKGTEVEAVSIQDTARDKFRERQQQERAQRLIRAIIKECDTVFGISNVEAAGRRYDRDVEADAL